MTDDVNRSLLSFIRHNIANTRLFPNYKRVESCLASTEKFDKFSEKTLTDVRASLFSEFDSFLTRNLGGVLNSKLAKTKFNRFGIGTLTELSKEFFSLLDDSSLEFVLFSDKETKVPIWGIAAVPAFFQLFFDSLFGNNAIKVYKRAGLRECDYFHSCTSELERRVLLSEMDAFGTLCPLIYDSVDRHRRMGSSQRIKWIASSIFSLESKLCEPIYEEEYYWERRSFDFLGKKFSWALVVPTSIFQNDRENKNVGRISEIETNYRQDTTGTVLRDDIVEIPISFVEGIKASEETDRCVVKTGTELKEANNRKDDGRVVFGTLDTFDFFGNATLEMNVEIGTGEVTLDVWNSLQVGSILTTDIDANELFLARLENGTTYYVKPGVYQGKPAVQIKKKV